MMVYTAKLKKKNVLVFALVIAAAVAVLLFAGKNGTEAPERANAETNDDRIAFLQSFGWEVEENPNQTQEVRIPEEANEVFDRYNELQKTQGYDLAPLAGACVKRYQYRITNYPDSSAPVYATLLVHNGRVIGGDVSVDSPTGKISGFAMPGALAKGDA